MKRLLKKFLAVSLCAALIGGTAVSLPVFVPDSGITASAGKTEDGFKYEENYDGTLTITEYSGEGWDVVIPGEIEGKKVTKIGEGAFCYTGYERIVIPDTVTSIEGGAFSNCYNLKFISLPGSIKYIGNEAFFWCYNLQSITIPNGVKSIGRWTFRGCSQLKSVYIPGSVTSIGESAFEDCAALENLTLSEGLKEIEWFSFGGCKNLSSLNLPKTVTYIGISAFYNCAKLTHVEIPDGVIFVDGGAFSGCSGLESIVFPDSVTKLSGNVFSGCSSLKEFTIPDSITKIEYNAFEGCKSLQSIDIPFTVTEIEENAFQGCYNMKTITVPESVTSIGEHAFGFVYVYEEGEFKYVKIPGFKLRGLTDSAIQAYANENDIEFEALEALKNTSVINSDIVQIGDKVRVSASANGGAGGYKYAYYYKRSTNTAWRTLGTEWGTTSSVAFAPTAEADYDIKVVVKDSAGKTAEKLFAVKAVKELELTNVSVVGRERVKLGSAIPMIGKAVGGAGNYTYSFYFKRSTNTNWKLLGDKFTATASARFKPTAKGTYDIRIDVKDSNGTIAKKFFTAKAV